MSSLSLKYRVLVCTALYFLTWKSPVSAIGNRNIGIQPDGLEAFEEDTMPFGFPATRTPNPNAKPSAYRYPQVPLDVKNYPAAPEPLKLQQVYVYVRHGERTPVGVRLVGAPANVPEHWSMCHTARRFNNAVLDVPNSDTNPTKTLQGAFPPPKIVERKDGQAVEGECLLGELTDLGRQSTYNFGANLRRLYIERLGFLPNILDNDAAVYFRTTNMPRTTESLQEIIRGLYPIDKCHPSSIPPIRVRNGRDENLIGNTYSCKRLEALQVGFAKAAADAFNPTLKHLDSKLSKYIGGNPIRVDGRPRASGIMDTVRSAIAHGIKVPPEFEDQTIVDSISKAVVSEWFSGCKRPFDNFGDSTHQRHPDKTEEVRRLGMGRLFEDMLRNMHHHIAKKGSDPLKLLVHSTHDTAIAAIRQTFDVFDDKWPPFTASVTFELFKDTSREDLAGSKTPSQGILSRIGGNRPKHYIRMRYQNQDVRLPICADEGKHLPGRPEFCTLEAFQARVEQLIPQDFDEECNVTG